MWQWFDAGYFLLLQLWFCDVWHGGVSWWSRGAAEWLVCRGDQTRGGDCQETEGHSSQSPTIWTRSTGWCWYPLYSTVYGRVVGWLPGICDFTTCSSARTWGPCSSILGQYCRTWFDCFGNDGLFFKPALKSNDSDPTNEKTTPIIEGIMGIISSLMIGTIIGSLFPTQLDHSYIIRLCSLLKFGVFCL
mgnify:CR=1 FL=1